MCRTEAHGGKTRTELLLCSLSPAHHGPGGSRKRQSHFFRGYGTMFFAEAFQRIGTILLGAFVWQRSFTGFPNTHGRLHTDDILQTQFRNTFSQPTIASIASIRKYG